MNAVSDQVDVMKAAGFILTCSEIKTLLSNIDSESERKHAFMACLHILSVPPEKLSLEKKFWKNGPNKFFDAKFLAVVPKCIHALTCKVDALATQGDGERSFDIAVR